MEELKFNIDCTKKEFIDAISLSLKDSNCDIDILEYIDEEEIEDIESYDDLYCKLEDAGAFDKEIIYYSNAIKYLAENDPSLTQSLELASEFDYKVNSLNSEKLASMLASENAKEDFSYNYEVIDDFFLNYDDRETKDCYCGDEIPSTDEFCSKECATHFQDEIT